MGGEAVGLHPVNWAVIVAYLGAMLGLGWYMSRKIKDSRGFFIASGRLGSLVVGLSLLGTYLSALTMMGLPGKSYGPEDWLWAIQVPFLLITAWVITGFVLPRYRAAGVISVYEFLEQRIHVSARMLASFCFLILSIGRMGLVLYLPALAFHTITGTDITTTIIVMGVIVTLYTVMGGIEAVIWTDAVQVVILAIGAVLSVGYILIDCQSAGANFFQLAAESHKFRIIEGSMNVTKLASAWLILETIFQTIRIYGTQQDMTQRFMATKSTKEANKSVWIAIIGYIPLSLLFYFIGSGLFVYYTAHVDPHVMDILAQDKPKYDAIYPHFIVTRLPIGIGGLVLAAVFAAAMSSIDSCMNSSSTVCVEDFYKRFSKTRRTDEQYLSIARWLTLIWGIAAVLMALAFKNVQYAQDTWSKVMSYSTTGVLALMALAFLPIRIRAFAAIAGWACAAASVAVMSYGTDLHFLLFPVIGNVLGFAVALGVNRLMGPVEPLPLGDLPEEAEPLEVADEG
ncbi:MAG TPA: sodium/solute symporter [Armatimonadota bacterium]|nr:sodium/solute symporter [Armatimonadota bacterium]